MRDVVIVGGSLAGAATAIHLARRGIDVEVLEQASSPRRKPCGEGLFSGGSAELRKLGVIEAVEAESAVITSMRFRLGDAAAEAALPKASTPHLGVRRDLLDGRLLAAAAQAGARVSRGVQVRKLVRGNSGFHLETTAGDVEGRVIVAADGINSRLRHDAGLQRPGRSCRYGVSAHMTVNTDVAARIDVIFLPGYEAYVTPVASGLVNVALLLRDPASMGFKGDLREPFLALLRPAGISGELVDEPMMAGPFPAAATALNQSNLVLCGDAAGFFDPITGEGMSLALQSARLCSDAVAAYLEGDSAAFERYSRQHRGLVRNATLLARLMLFLAAHPGLGRQAIRNLQRRPDTLTRLIAVNIGTSRFRNLRPRDLSALLLGR
jgi:flavin-dependent dehydrogenase